MKIPIEKKNKAIAFGLAGIIFIIILGSLMEWFLETDIGQVVAGVIILGIIFFVFKKFIWVDFLRSLK